jgi:4-oxalocrotonate tautomerase
MPSVSIVLREGRSVEQKREMVRAVREAIVRTAGAKPESVHVIVYDLQARNLAREGILMADRT